MFFLKFPAEFVLPPSDVIIIDCGSSAAKAGFSGENNPRISVPNVVGKPKRGAAVGIRSEKDSYIGEDAQQKRAVLNLCNPIERGIITNWDDFEIYFEYILRDGLKLSNISSNYSILLTEVLHNPSRNREKLTELMLEKFLFKSFFLAPTPPLALYGYGIYSGVVLDSGEGQTQIVPVYEGFAMRYGSRYIPMGGSDVNLMIQYLLQTNSTCCQYFQKSKDRDFLTDIKEELCYVAVNYKEEIRKHARPSKIFRLPDGNHIELGSELFRCTECLFEPTILDIRTGGIHENIYRSIQLSDPSIKHILYDHIVLSGGNTLFPGLQQRLATEIKHMAEPNAIVRVLAKPDRKNSAFLGASLLSSLTRFKEMSITYPEYFDIGPSIVNRKCF